jgi:type IV pilus assembly protein PilV
MEKTPMNLSRKQNGATLIEALVSILVLSLGLLGIAGMQLSALNFQKSSWATHRIAELTSDISERIRSNPSGAKNGSYTLTPTYSVAKSATMTNNLCRASGAADCTTDKIANDDLRDWLKKSQEILPGGAVRLEGSTAAGFVITVMYKDKDFVDVTTGQASTAVDCTGSETASAWRNCCPPTASASAGVRCYRSEMLL